MAARRSSEHTAHTCDAIHKGVYLVLGVIEGERGSHHALHAEVLHHGLGAVMTSAHGYAEAVEECAHVEVVYVAHEERHHSILALGCAEEAHGIQ